MLEEKERETILRTQTPIPNTLTHVNLNESLLTAHRGPANENRTSLFIFQPVNTQIREYYLTKYENVI